MKKYKTFAILLAGTLLLGCPAGQAFAAAVTTTPNVISESIPDTSELDGKLLLPDTANGKAAREDGFTAKIDVSEIETGAETFSKKVIYRTYDKEDDPATHMPGELEANGDTYVIVEVDRPLFVSQETVTPKQSSYESEVFVGDGADKEPAETWMDTDGTVYRLVSKELIEQTAQERTEYKEIPVTFTAVEAGVQIPDQKNMEIEDLDTKQMVQATLEIKDKTVIREYWRDDFVFPITITGYDAEVFILNGVEIPKEADLTAYADTFLQYLKLDGNSYRVSQIEWDGEPYEKNGVLMRNAIGKGSKFVKDIDATYSGEVKLPAIVGKSWHCTYEEDIPKSKQTIYTMTATATYQLKNMAVVEKSFAQKIYDKVVGVITAAYEAVFEAFEEHPVISSIPLVLIAAMIASLITKKCRNRCVYNSEVKCPYKKHNKEICKTCVHYHKRNQV